MYQKQKLEQEDTFSRLDDNKENLLFKSRIWCMIFRLEQEQSQSTFNSVLFSFILDKCQKGNLTGIRKPKLRYIPVNKIKYTQIQKKLQNKNTIRIRPHHLIQRLCGTPDAINIFVQGGLATINDIPAGRSQLPSWIGGKTSGDVPRDQRDFGHRIP